MYFIIEKTLYESEDPILALMDYICTGKTECKPSKELTMRQVVELNHAGIVLFKWNPATHTLKIDFDLTFAKSVAVPAETLGYTYLLDLLMRNTMDALHWIEKLLTPIKSQLTGDEQFYTAHYHCMIFYAQLYTIAHMNDTTGFDMVKVQHILPRFNSEVLEILSSLSTEQSTNYFNTRSTSNTL